MLRRQQTFISTILQQTVTEDAAAASTSYGGLFRSMFGDEGSGDRLKWYDSLVYRCEKAVHPLTNPHPLWQTFPTCDTVPGMGQTKGSLVSRSIVITATY